MKWFYFKICVLAIFLHLSLDKTTQKKNLRDVFGERDIEKFWCKIYDKYVGIYSALNISRKKKTQEGPNWLFPNLYHCPAFMACPMFTCNLVSYFN